MSKICNPKKEVSKGIMMNDEDYMTILLSNLKSLNRGIATGSSIGYFAAGGGIYENEICASAEFKVVIPEIMNNFTPVRKEG